MLSMWLTRLYRTYEELKLDNKIYEIINRTGKIDMLYRTYEELKRNVPFTITLVTIIYHFTDMVGLTDLCNNES